MTELQAFALRLLDCWNAHDVEGAAAFYADDYEGFDVGQSRSQHGARQRVAVLIAYMRAFPDLYFTGEALAQDDRVALFWTMHGTHQGTFMRIPPTGRRVEVQGVSLLTVENGKVVRGLNIWDTAGLLRQLGLLPEL